MPNEKNEQNQSFSGVLLKNLEKTTTASEYDEVITRALNNLMQVPVGNLDAEDASIVLGIVNQHVVRLKERFIGSKEDPQIGESIRQFLISRLHLAANIVEKLKIDEAKLIRLQAGAQNDMELLERLHMHGQNPVAVLWMSLFIIATSEINIRLGLLENLWEKLTYDQKLDLMSQTVIVPQAIDYQDFSEEYPGRLQDNAWYVSEVTQALLHFYSSIKIEMGLEEFQLFFVSQLSNEQSFISSLAEERSIDESFVGNHRKLEKLLLEGSATYGQIFTNLSQRLDQIRKQQDGYVSAKDITLTYKSILEQEVDEGMFTWVKEVVDNTKSQLLLANAIIVFLHRQVDEHIKSVFKDADNGLVYQLLENINMRLVNDISLGITYLERMV